MGRGGKRQLFLSFNLCNYHLQDVHPFSKYLHLHLSRIRPFPLFEDWWWWWCSHASESSISLRIPCNVRTPLIAVSFSELLAVFARH